MREIREIKEEVFKRSKARIKRRKRIISAMLTLCVCLAVGITAFAFKEPYVTADGNDNMEGYDILIDEEDAPVSEEIIKIKYGKTEYTEKDKIIEITNTLQAIIDGCVDDSEGVLKHHSTADISAEASLCLCVITETGEEEFVISGNSLINKSTGVVYPMNEKQRADLLSILE